MILTRKILGPTIVLFALLLIGLLGYFYNSYQTLNQQQEQQYLSTLNEGFGSEVENKELIALGLAQEVANDPQIQKAFADQDRVQLLAVSTPFFERMKQFHNPPSTSFLRVQNPDMFGDDLSAYREMVVTVNRNQQPAVGFETSQSGFNSRAVVPVFYQGRFIGSVEVGIDAGIALLEHFVEEYGNEWHIALKQEVILLSSPDFERIAQPFARALERLGIAASIRTVDPAQYENRMEDYDYDMTVEVFGQSLSPGNEQRDFWGSASADIPGGRNTIGIKDPVVDDLVNLVIAAPTRESLIARTRALDRVLLSGHYVIPHWHIRSFRVAFWDMFGRPAEFPKYGFAFDAWWLDQQKQAALGRRGTVTN